MHSLKGLICKLKARFSDATKDFLIYARRKIMYTVFLTGEKLTGYSHEKRLFFRTNGYRLNLKNPRTFSEKIVWKKLYDRNPLLPITTDKYLVRTYIKQVLGQKQAEKILIPLLWAGKNPHAIPFNELPKNYIIKANNGSSRNIVIDGGGKVREEIIAKCRCWLKTTYEIRSHQWAYRKIRPKIIIEHLLKDKEGKLTKDYKFYVFWGVCGLVGGGNNLYSTEETWWGGWLGPNWNWLGVEPRPLPEKPGNYEEMLSLAQELGKDFDFVRVDLYSIDEKIYFGELTHYPAGGMTRIKPKSLDMELGRLWRLEPRYWCRPAYRKKERQNSR